MRPLKVVQKVRMVQKAAARLLGEDNIILCLWLKELIWLQAGAHYFDNHSKYWLLSLNLSFWGSSHCVCEGSLFPIFILLAIKTFWWKASSSHWNLAGGYRGEELLSGGTSPFQFPLGEVHFAIPCLLKNLAGQLCLEMLLDPELIWASSCCLSFCFIVAYF